MNMHPRDLVTNTFRQRFSADPAFIVLMPGRVNIFGEHVETSPQLLPARSAASVKNQGGWLK
jgi:hypothetical protein